MTVTITEHDIRHGRPRSCGRCPVALAIRRARPDLYVQVRTDTVTLTMHYGTIRREACHVALPDHVCDWIAAFDHYKEVQPTTFELEL